MSSVSASISKLERKETSLQALCGMAPYFRIVAAPIQLFSPEDLVRAAQLRTSCKTGKRQILDYLFSPLVETASRAMRER